MMNVPIFPYLLLLSQSEQYKSEINKFLFFLMIFFSSPKVLCMSGGNLNVFVHVIEEYSLFLRIFSEYFVEVHLQ